MITFGGGRSGDRILHRHRRRHRLTKFMKNSRRECKGKP